MIKYSGSYANTECNFVLLNIDNDNHIEDRILYGLLCVVQNIILRGMISIPSDYLKQQLGNLGNIEEPCNLLSREYVEWRAIKGDKENVDYPAETFYEKILPNYFGKENYLRNLIIPEAEFSSVLGYSTKLDGQCVDFYIPQIKTVIEIDGQSHEDAKQKYKDNIRDEALKKNNIKTIRILTRDLRIESEEFKNVINNLINDIKSNNITQNYIKNIDISKDNVRIKYDAILRIQLMLLECFKNGKFKINDNDINICIVDSDIPNLEELILIAYEDIKMWLHCIAQLLKYNCKFPEIFVNSLDMAPSINIDFSMFKRYSDMTITDNSTVYIRNDYYCEANYYKVATADTLQYKFNIETKIEDDAAMKYILKNIFGFEEFNQGQLPIIKNILERNDTIGILPTGGGKSLTYQICALLQPGVTVVIVPIISLMQDQKRGMDLKHLTRSNFLSSGQSGENKEQVLRDFICGNYQIIWSSPERFQNKEFREALTEINRKMNFSLAVIDEVHCLSEWGHDFRVSYLALVKTLRQYCPEACLLGLTATASQAVLEDLKVEFENDGSGVKALMSMNRDELTFQRITVSSEKEKLEKIIELVKENDEPYINLDGTKKQKIGLIFCPTVMGKNISCTAVRAELEKNKIIDRVAYYHGQMNMQQRTCIQNEFMDNKYDVMICTKAFGMGIDKDNVKYTIHSCLPQSVESFYQEAGRAGREKDKSVKSNCYIIYCPESEDMKNNVEKIFSPDIGIDKRKKISARLRNDLSTIMFFWNSNRSTVEEEYENISWVLKKLYHGETILYFGDKDKGHDNSLEQIQSALYKLSILGIVDNWTVQYATINQGSVDVEYCGLDSNKILGRLLAYIHKYDTEFRIDADSTRYHKYFMMVHDKNKKIIAQYIRVLIEWGNENVLYNRLQSTYTMLQWMNSNISDKEFRKNIDEYFKFSERSVIFEGIIYNPLQYDAWFDILFEKNMVTNKRTTPITKAKAESNLASLQRYLESYKSNTGLNYLSGILRIIVGKYEKTEGEWRFREALQNIKESLSSQQQQQIISMTLDIAKNIDVDDKDILSKEILEYYPGIERMIFNSLEDRYSFSNIIDEYIQKIKVIVKENL